MPEKGADNVPYYDRFNWHALRRAALDIVDLAQKDEIGCEKLVFFGGLGFYFHLRAAFGAQVTPGWRGTHDIDLMVFGKGCLPRLVSAIGGSKIFDSETTMPSHFPHKLTCRGTLAAGAGVLQPNARILKIDLYGEDDSGKIEVDGRRLSSDRIIYDPPEMLNVGNEGKVAVPSPRDLIILKLNYLWHREFLWPSEYADIAGGIAVAEKRGISPEQIFTDIYRKMTPGDQKERAKKAFAELCRFCRKNRGNDRFILPPGDCFHFLDVWLKKLDSSGA